MPSSSYEMIKWIEFDSAMPPEDTPLIVWSQALGVDFAIRQGTTLQVITSGYFSHWALRPVGVSKSQRWLDWAVSWLR